MRLISFARMQLPGMLSIARKKRNERNGVTFTIIVLFCSNDRDKIDLPCAPVMSLRFFFFPFSLSFFSLSLSMNVRVARMLVQTRRGTPLYSSLIFNAHPFSRVGGG